MLRALSVWKRARLFIQNTDMKVLIALSIFMFGMLGFWAIAEDLIEPDPHSLDYSILYFLRSPDDLSNPLGPLWFEYAVSDVTALGGHAIISILMLSATLYLVATRQMQRAILILAAVVSGALISSVLKLGFDRPRPDIVDHLTHAMSSSFPSGHAFLSAVVYLSLGALIARAHQQITIRTIVMMGAVLLVLIIGLSRIYLGVHWPTDVVAGWFFGAAWAAIWWLADYTWNVDSLH